MNQVDPALGKMIHLKEDINSVQLSPQEIYSFLEFKT